MSFTHIGTDTTTVGNVTGTSTVMTVPAGTTNDLRIFAIVYEFASPPSVSSLSGGGVTTWTRAGSPYTDATGNQTFELWYGSITGSGTSLTVNFSASIATHAVDLYQADFRSSNSGAMNWVVEASGGVSSTASTATTFPSLTSVNAGELYFGFEWLAGTGTSGATSGFTYQNNVGGDPYVYNLNLAASTAYAPAETQSTNSSYGGFAVIIDDGFTASTGPGQTISPQYRLGTNVGPMALRRPRLALNQTASVVMQTGADTGTGTDTATVTSTEPGSDTGSGSESQTMINQASDTGSGSESQIMVNQASDTGSGADTASMTATEPGSDTGSGSESQIMVNQASDTGSAADTGAMVVTQTGADTGSGVDNAQTTVIQSDTGSGADTASMTATEPGSDTASGSDTGQMNPVQSDTGSGADTAQTTVIQSDTASGVDTASAASTEPAFDTGSSADTAGTTTTEPGSDSASGSESQIVVMQASDVGSGVDIAVSWIQTWTSADSGVFVDNSSGVTSDNTNVANPRSVVVQSPSRVNTLAPEGRSTSVAINARVYTPTGVDSGH